MSRYKYDTINGQRVEKNVAAQFKKWAADFKKATGEDLLITSGTRTAGEQQRLHDDFVSGKSKVKAAIPRESSHCEIGPAGPRALDLHDSGRDAGVTTKGTVRHTAATRTGKKYGFTWGGWGVPASEGWHFENHEVDVGVYGVIGKSKEAVKHAVQKAKVPPKTMLDWRWSGIQEMLKRFYGYRGGIGDAPGRETIEAMQRFLNLNDYGDLRVDGTFDTATCKAVQRWLKRRWGYRDEIDAIPGPETKAAWNRAEKANAAAF